MLAAAAPVDLAEAVGAAGGSPAGVLHDLDVLLSHSLLVREEGPDGEPRLRMLATIREFAAGRLAESGEEGPVRDAHARAHLELARRARAGLDSLDSEAWLDRLEAAHDDLRAALRHALAADPGTAVELAGALARFWLWRGHLTEGRGWVERALAAGGGVAPVEPPARAAALEGLGLLAHYTNDYEGAMAAFDAALREARAVAAPLAEARALSGLAMVVGRHRDPAGARDMYARALAIARRLRNLPEVVRLLERLGTVLWYERGADPEARHLVEESVAGAARLGLRREQARSRQALGWLALSEGSALQARRLLREAARELGR